MERQRLELTIEGAHIINRWKNFSGVNGKYKGTRDFSIMFDDIDMAEKLLNDGWPIHIKEPREEGDSPFCYLIIKTRFDKFPPRVFMVRDDNLIQLDENTVGELDSAAIVHADIHVTGNYYEDPNTGRHGVSPYLKEGYFTIEADPFYEKYKNFNGAFCTPNAVSDDNMIED